MKSKKIEELLNNHFKTNISLGTLYTKFFFEVSNTPLCNLAKYIKDLAGDKLGIHKDKIVDYMISSGYKLEKLSNIESYNFKEGMSAKEIVAEMIKHEKSVIEEVNKFAEIALSEKDYQSFEFIQWFVKDGLKDFNEVLFISELFEQSSDLLLIDQKIESILE
ncbi:MAG: hypothetical protein K2L64_00155 [Ureaplasma sp.]|nr:hypothetical protein [Ureaplasma sp.]